MKFTVPIHAVIESSSLEAAQATAQKIEQLLKQSLVKSLLSGQGVQLSDVRVGAPTQTR